MEDRNNRFRTPLEGNRMQSQLGKENERQYKKEDKHIKLIMARVLKVNYKYNTVDLVTAKNRDVIMRNPKDEGRFSARLPIQFGGKTPSGEVYGTNTLVTVGSLVLVGFIEGQKETPIVLNIYGETDNQSQLTQTTFLSADESEEAIQRELWQLFSLYPSMTYENIDGHGNKEVTFSGKSFMYITNTMTGDGLLSDDDFEYEFLPSAKRNNGDLIEPISEDAPMVLYVHQSDTSDHRLTFMIQQDGTMRVGSRHLDGGGVTFQELGTDGSFRIVQKQGTTSMKDENEADKFSNVGIDENGHVSLKSRTNHLEITDDGVFVNGQPIGASMSGELEGLRKGILDANTSIGIIDGRIELKANQTSIDEINNVVKDQEALFTVSFDEINSKVSNLEYSIPLTGINNLLTNTHFKELPSVYGKQVDAERIERDKSVNSVKVTRGGVSEEFGVYVGETYPITFKANTDYVLSFKGLFEGIDKINHIHITNSRGFVYKLDDLEVIERNKDTDDPFDYGFSDYELKFNLDNDIDKAYISIGVDDPTGKLNTFEIYQVQVEEGTEATRWGTNYRDAPLANIFETEIKQLSDSITARADAIERGVNELGEEVEDHTTRIQEAELKIQPDSIISTVRRSQAYTQDLEDARAYAKELTDAIESDIGDVLGGLDDLDAYIEGAFKDGIITEAESKAIATHINTLKADKANLDARYSEIMVASEINTTEQEATNLRQSIGAAKEDYDEAHANLISTILIAIEDGKTTQEEAVDVNLHFDAYRYEIANLSAQLEKAIDYIAKTKAKEAENNAKAYTDGVIVDVNTEIVQLAELIALRATKTELSQSMGQTKKEAKEYADGLTQSVRSEVEDVVGLLTDLDEYIEGAFKDGIITEAEATAIGKHIQLLNIEKSEMEAKYDEIHKSTHIQASVKVAMEVARADYLTKHDTLISTIESLIAKKAVTDIDKADLDTKFMYYDDALADLARALEKGIDSITDDKVQKAEERSTEYIDGIERVISERVSEAEIAVRPENIVAVVRRSTSYQGDLQEAKETASADALKAKADAEKALRDAEEAQSRADKAVQDAETAQARADKAVTDAEGVNSLVTDISSDSKLTPSEKKAIKKEWDIIVAERSEIIAQAQEYGVSVTAYISNFNSLNSYITPLLSDLSTTSDIAGNVFRGKFKDYYTSKTSLLKLVTDKAKSLSDGAQQTANKAESDASNAQARADKAVQDASTAQARADKAVQDAETAQARADKAVQDASTAQTKANSVDGLVKDIASDSKLTPSEKKTIKKEWEIIQGERSEVLAQAQVYGLPTTVYTTAYSALSSYISPLLNSMSTTSNITGTEFRSKFKDYYTAKTSLLKVITDRAKTLADLAQQRAEKAEGDASTAQGTANKAEQDAADAQARADKAVQDASTAQSRADKAVQDASSAQARADKAVQDAEAVNSLVTDISSDSKLTPSEKKAIKKEWDIIVAERSEIVAQAGKYSVSTATYTAEYNALDSYITPLLSNMGTTSTIVGNTFRLRFKEYYTAKTTLLKLVTDKAKNLSDDAQEKANKAESDASKAQQTANKAVTDASTAQARADKAVTDAETAQARADKAVTDASTAQARANKAVQDASKAQAKADKAESDAASAQNKADTVSNLVYDISNDSKLTPSEKKAIKKEWEIIQEERAQIVAQAQEFGVSTTNYTTKYSALNTYIAPMLSNMSTTSNIVGTTFRARFKEYYTAKTALLKLVTGEAKSLADEAQQKADKAESDASSAQQKANKAESDASSAQQKANKAESDAARAQDKADKAESDASKAQARADKAVQDASAVNGLVADIANDSKLTPAEKKAIKKEWEIIVAERLEIISQANKYGLSSTSYTNNYNTLSSYITPLLADMGKTEAIVGNTFRLRFKNYYSAKTTLLKLITDTAKVLADGAKTRADDAYDLAGETKVTVDGLVEVVDQAMIDIQPDKITSTVISNKQYKDNIKHNIDSIELGGRNLIKGSNEFVDSNSEIHHNIPFRRIGYEWGYKYDYNLTKGTYTISINVFNDNENESELRIGTPLGYEYIDVPGNTFTKLERTFELHENKIGVAYILINSVNEEPILVSYVMLEKGNKATDWTPAPEDVNASIDGIQIGGTNLVKLDSWLGGYVIADINSHNVAIKIHNPDFTTIPYKAEIRLLTGGVSGTIVDEVVLTGEDIGEDVIFSRTKNLTPYSTATVIFKRLADDKPIDKELTDKSKLKVERGNKVTSWSPAPEDQVSQDEFTGETLVSKIEQTADSVRISANKIHISGDTTIEDGSFRWEHAKGGTLELGGEGDENGILMVYDTDGELIAELNGDQGGFSELLIGDLEVTGHISAPEIVKEQTEDVTYYVRGDIGDDENTGVGGWDNGLYSVQEAVNRIPTLLNADVHINIGSYYDIEEEVVIQGNSGGGNIYIDLSKTEIVGSLQVINCAVSVYVNGGGITRPGSTGIAVDNQSSNYFEIRDVTINGGGGSTIGIRTWRGGHSYIRSCAIYNVNDAISVSSTGVAIAIANKGKGSRNGIRVSSGGIISTTNTNPGGDSANIVIAEDAHHQGPYGADFGTAKPVAPPKKTTTTTWKTTTSTNWRPQYNGEWGGSASNRYNPHQGKWSSWGIYRGYWIFGSGPSNAVKGSKIKRMRVRLTRTARGGRTGNVGIVIRAHKYTSTPTSGSPYMSTTNTTSAFSTGQTKWVTLPTSFHSIFQDGSHKGIGIYTTSGHQNNYAIMEHGAWLEITYEK